MPPYNGPGRHFGRTQSSPRKIGIEPGGSKPTKKVPERLPDGSQFSATYDATEQRWRGSLVVAGPTNEPPQTFQGTARALFTLLSRLDSFYRKWLKERRK